MKERVLAVLFVIFTINLTAQSHNYVIKGEVHPKASFDSKVFIVDLKRNVKIDSAEIKDNNYIFKGEIEKALCCNIVMRQKEFPYMNSRIPIILEAGEIIIEPDGKTILGTSLNRTLSDYQKELSEVYKSWMELGGIESTKRIDRISRRYLVENKENVAGAMILHMRVPSSATLKSDEEKQLDREVFEGLYSMAGEYARSLPSVEAAVTKFNQRDITQVGDMFIDFTIETGNIDGSKVSLSDYVGKGKYILLDFWASWCGPCKRELPIIAEVYEEFKGHNFDVVSVAVNDKREKTVEAARENNITWNQILDAQNIPGTLYSIDAIPHLILFDPDGRIVARGIRGPQIREVVAKALAIN